MRNNLFILAFLSFVLFFEISLFGQKQYIGQFAFYYNEDVDRLPNPKLVTHIIFASARINPDFSLRILSPKMLRKNSSLKGTNPNLKVLLLVGGVASANFSEAVRTKKSRSKFLDVLGETMNKYNLDGFDFDWEFPTLVDAKTGQNGIPADTQNYTLLMKEYKERFPDKLLTVDVGNQVKHIDFEDCSEYVDYFNLMSYDYANDLQNSPLYKSNMTASACISASIEKLSKRVPVEKIAMGISLYGRKVFRGGKQIAYNRISRFAKHMGFTLCRDEVALTPFYIDKKGKLAISFDDETSVREKCKYAKSKSLGGVVSFQLLDDDDDFSLTSAIADEMNLTR